MDLIHIAEQACFDPEQCCFSGGNSFFDKSEFKSVPFAAAETVPGETKVEFFVLRHQNDAGSAADESHPVADRLFVKDVASGKFFQNTAFCGEEEIVGTIGNAEKAVAPVFIDLLLHTFGLVKNCYLNGEFAFIFPEDIFFTDQCKSIGTIPCRGGQFKDRSAPDSGKFASVFAFGKKSVA